MTASSANQAAAPLPDNSLADLANRHGSDKGNRIHCAHDYARIYQRILGPCRLAPLKLAEIGLIHVYAQAEFAGRLDQAGCASLRMWADYLPNANISGLDIADLVALGTARIRIARGDQGSRADLESFARAHGPFDVIVDDGSHASHHQQIALATLFPHLAPGGLYVVEDLHFQPPELEIREISTTRDFLRHMSRSGEALKLPITQAEYGYLLANVAAVNFFDSLSPKWPAQQAEDALAVIRKAGEHAFLPPRW